MSGGPLSLAKHPKSFYISNIYPLLLGKDLLTLKQRLQSEDWVHHLVVALWWPEIQKWSQDVALTLACNHFDVLSVQTEIYEAEYQTEHNDHKHTLQENKRLRKKREEMRQQVALLQEQVAFQLSTYVHTKVQSNLCEENDV